MGIVYFIYGIIFGSTANALIDRLPREESWFKGRSKCDKCKHELNWRDLLPVVSYLWLKGRCRYCHSPIPVRNLAVELTMGLAFVVIVGSYQLAVISLMLAGIFWVTLIIFVMDMETKLVSEAMVVLWGGLVIGYQLSVGSLQLVVGNFVGLFFGVFVIGGLWAATRGRGMGFGDVEMMVPIGLWLGWPKVLIALWIAFVVGGMVGGWQLAIGKSKMKSEIAFGPFLIIGAWAAFVWGDAILKIVTKYGF